jgi:hypothetical protein
MQSIFSAGTLRKRKKDGHEKTSKECKIFAMMTLVGNPTVAASSDSLNRKPEFRSGKYWVAKAKKNIARGNK